MRYMMVTVLMAGLLAIPAAGFGGENEELVLIEVNGEAITGADLDRMIMETHRGGGMDAARAQGLVPRLLDKAVRDRLILQDAFAMGMDTEPSVVRPVNERVMRRAISLYSRSQVDLPEVTDDEVREFYSDYYHKIQIRQISLPSEDECRQAMERIRSGEVSMGTLALEISMDSAKVRGGLHNDKYWADVEGEFREAVEGLDAGEYSEPFPLRDVWSFVRVESRAPADFADFEQFEPYIRDVLRNQKYEQAWADLVADHESRVQVQVNRPVLDEVLEDEAILYRGEFKFGTDTPVLAVDPGHFVTERQFRIAMSSLAMEMGTSPIGEILDATIAQEREKLVLAYFAEQEGWFDDPEVVAFRERQLDEVLITAYLEENIHQKVSVRREEFERYYEENGEQFRGPDEVSLSILTISEPDVLEDAVQRLAEGADFDFLRAEIGGSDPEAVAEPGSWSPITVFSDAIVGALEGMEVGQTSDPLPFAAGWLLFRLDGRREGSIPPIDEVEAPIRKALYLREFTRLLDEHLARLEEASVITRHEDRIRAWAEGDS